MITLATAHWAVGYAMQRLLIISAVVLAISAIGVFLGARLLGRGSAKLGWLLLVMGCLLPFFSYFARPRYSPPGRWHSSARK